MRSETWLLLQVVLAGVIGQGSGTHPFNSHLPALNENTEVQDKERKRQIITIDNDGHSGGAGLSDGLLRDRAFI